MEKIIDCRGMACPLPVVNTKKATEEAHPGDVLIVLVDNKIAVQNLRRFASHKGFAVTSEKRGEQEFAVVITVSGVAETAPEEVACAVDARKKGMLVVLSANTMGTGDAKLGASLMKAFVFALTRQDQLPEAILWRIPDGGRGRHAGGSEAAGKRGRHRPHLRHLSGFLRFERKTGRGRRDQYV